MWRSYIAIGFAVSSLLWAPIVPLSVDAQQFKDCRTSGGCTDEDYSRALFPDTEPQMRTRGLAPVRPSEPSAQRPAVALNVFFEFNSDKILPRYHDDLDTLGRVLTSPQHTDYHIGIEGHTDNIGSDRYNQTLSERRAASVKRYLVQAFSIPPERLVVKGLGENNPRTTNDTPKGREENRRVEVINLGK